jgi:hypothetical protein
MITSLLYFFNHLTYKACLYSSCFILVHLTRTMQGSARFRLYCQCVLTIFQLRQSNQLDFSHIHRNNCRVTLGGIICLPLEVILVSETTP